LSTEKGGGRGRGGTIVTKQFKRGFRSGFGDNILVKGSGVRKIKSVGKIVGHCRATGSANFGTTRAEHEFRNVQSIKSARRNAGGQKTRTMDLHAKRETITRRKTHT